MNTVHGERSTDRDPRQDFFDLMNSADRERADEIWRFIYLVQDAAAAIPGPRDDADDFDDGVVSIELSGFGTAGQRLLIPAALLYGVEPRFVPAIVESYVEAFKTGGRRADPDQAVSLPISTVRQIARLAFKEGLFQGGDHALNDEDIDAEVENSISEGVNPTPQGKPLGRYFAKRRGHRS